MPEPRNTSVTIEDLMDIGGAIFHGHVDAKDSNGQYSGVLHDGERFDKAMTAQPYGFRSYAPQNTGLVATYSQAGLLVLSQHNQLPSGVSEPLSGETLLYNSQGARVHLDTNGDINITQKAGRFINLGSSPEFVALASKADSNNDLQQSKYDGHTHTVTVDPGTHAGTTATPSTPVGSLPSVTASEVKAT